MFVMPFDIVNAMFQLGSAAMIWLNVVKIHKDKRVHGVVWYTFVFYATLGVWNIFFYHHLQQWWSIVAGSVVIFGNIAWCVLAVKYSRISKDKIYPQRFRDI